MQSTHIPATFSDFNELKQNHGVNAPPPSSAGQQPKDPLMPSGGKTKTSIPHSSAPQLHGATNPFLLENSSKEFAQISFCLIEQVYTHAKTILMLQSILASTCGSIKPLPGACEKVIHHLGDLIRGKEVTNQESGCGSKTDTPKTRLATTGLLIHSHLSIPVEEAHGWHRKLHFAMPSHGRFLSDAAILPEI